MPFTVAWKKALTEEVINEESYPSLKTALESASMVTLTRPIAVAISVTDEKGSEHFTRVVPSA